VIVNQQFRWSAWRLRNPNHKSDFNEAASVSNRIGQGNRGKTTPIDPELMGSCPSMWLFRMTSSRQRNSVLRPLNNGDLMISDRVDNVRPPERFRSLLQL
jgi:hypothetical protein